MLVKFENEGKKREIITQIENQIIETNQTINSPKVTGKTLESAKERKAILTISLKLLEDIEYLNKKRKEVLIRYQEQEAAETDPNKKAEINARYVRLKNTSSCKRGCYGRGYSGWYEKSGIFHFCGCMDTHLTKFI
jgi:hypothetical protein